MQEKIKVCQVSSVHKTFDTRIFYKVCMSLSKKYEVYYVSANAKNEIREGIHIVGVPLSLSRLKRQFQLNRVYKELLKVDAEIYQFHDPELMSIGIKLKKKGKKVIFDSHEDVPQQILDKTYLNPKIAFFISRVYSIYEKRLLKKYNAIITVTPTIVERLKLINPKCYQITNYPIDDGERDTNDDRRFGRIICFFGGVTDLWCQKDIIHAIEDIDVKYIFAGPLDEERYLEILKKEPGYEKADYLGVIKHSECINIMHKSSAGLALSDYTANMGGKRGTLGNNKLFEYMQAGIPVIATDFELWREVVNQSDCGTLVNPHDSNAIKAAIQFYINNPKEAHRQGDNGRKAVKERYNWSTQEVILFNLYKALLGNEE